MVVQVETVVLANGRQHSGAHSLDATFRKPDHVLPHLLVVRRQRVARMATVPDDSNEKDSWIVLDLHQALQRLHDLLVLLLDIVGSDLPVGV